MNETHFRTLDLNLFRVLLAIIEARSVAAAAVELSVTPSAVSHALSRLRVILDDPLFERRAGQLVPTPFAIDIARRAGPAIEQLHEAVTRNTFDPSTAEREFVIAAGGYSAAVIVPSLIEDLRTAAPGVRLRMKRIDGGYADDVDHRRVDLALGILTPETRNLEWRPIVSDEMVWAARRRHPYLRDPLTMEMLARAPHVVVDRIAATMTDEFKDMRRFLDEAAELRTAYRAAVGSVRASGRAVAIVPDIAHALDIVRRTDCVTLTLRRFAEAIAHDDLQLMTSTLRTPILEIGAAFRRDREHDLGFAWLLQRIEALAARARAKAPPSTKETR